MTDGPEDVDGTHYVERLDVSISNTGIDVDTTVRSARHAVGVTTETQQIYGNLVGHDLHLVRLEDGTTASDVNDWMNWADVDGLNSDGAEPETFLGGISDVFTDSLPKTGYFHVNLKPGDYSWVAEVPDPTSKGLLETFSGPCGR